MSPGFPALAVAALLFLPSCGSETPETDSQSGAAPSVAAFSGTYHVSGRTVENDSGEGRAIEGTVVLAQGDAGYTASFELTTLFPTPGEPTEAQVVGTGTGELKGAELLGTASTQIILAQVPGVDAQFAFLPRAYGPRITSESVSRLNPDGSITIEIESRAAEGEEYQTTKTTLTGKRIANERVAP